MQQDNPVGIVSCQSLVRNASRYVDVIDKLKEHSAVHIQDQATVAARAMKELKAPVFTKMDRPVRMYWADKDWTFPTKNKRNPGAEVDNESRVEDWEQKLAVNKYFDALKTYAKGTKA